MQRRDFLALAGAAPLWRFHTGDALRLGLVLPEDPSDPASARGADGIQLGLEEARQTTTLLARELLVSSAPIDLRATVVVSLAPTPPWHPLVIDARARYPRGAPEHVFRVGVEEDHPGVLWRPDLERYGAAQLNQRFRARFGYGMDENAWAGWFAIKLAVEAMLRSRQRDPVALAHWLGESDARPVFDGHKGSGLSFRSGRRLHHASLIDAEPVRETAPSDAAP